MKKFGAFVKLEEGIDGMIPNSEMLSSVNEGDQVEAWVLKISKEIKNSNGNVNLSARIDLTMKPA